MHLYFWKCLYYWSISINQLYYCAVCFDMFLHTLSLNFLILLKDHFDNFPEINYENWNFFQWNKTILSLKRWKMYLHNLHKYKQYYINVPITKLFSLAGVFFFFFFWQLFRYKEAVSENSSLNYRMCHLLANHQLS